MIFWNSDLVSRLSCSDEERAAIPTLVKKLVDLAEKARSDSLKQIRPEDLPEDAAILDYGFKLIEEGLSGEALEEVCSILLATGTSTGFAFLRECIYVEALLSIALGDPPEITLRKLLPYSGAESALAALAYYESARGDDDR